MFMISVNEGAEVGTAVGDVVGDSVGIIVGVVVGKAVGVNDGAAEIFTSSCMRRSRLEHCSSR